MTFRAAIPNTARNPTSEPIETFPSLSQVANTPPTSADGSVMKARMPAARRKQPAIQQDAYARGNRIDENLPLGHSLSVFSPRSPTLAETWSAPEAGFDKPREFAGALHRAITAANDTELLFAIWEQNAETVRALNDPRSKMLY